MDKLQITAAAIAALNNNDAANFLVASTPGGIERQEKRGQEDFVNSTLFPFQCEMDSAKEGLEVLEKWGFKFGKKVDELFMECVLPDGWKKEASDHSMHSDIVDDKGRRRVGIFYKAAFYDRRASFHIVARYGFHYLFDDDRGSNHLGYEIKKDGKTIKTFLFSDLGSDKKVVQKIAMDYLDKNYPDREKLGSYWDED